MEFLMADLKRVLSYDPATRTKTTYHYDWKTDDSYIQTQQDVQPILEDNKIWRNDVDQRKHDFRRVASIPLHLFYQIPAAIRNDSKELRKWLNQPEHSAFRTWEGSV